MTESTDTQPTTGTEKLRVNGACLIEIWRTSRYIAPNCFWRELQADGIMSLWRIMEPAFAKQALKAERFTLEKDGHIVLYAARPFDPRGATLDDYQRLRKLTHAFKSTPDPLLLCPDCWGTKEIQATRVKIDAATNKPIGNERFVCDCPTCSSTPEPTPEQQIKTRLETIGTYTIVEEVPGIDPAMQYFVKGPDGVPLKSSDNGELNFATIDAARQYLRLALVPDECIKLEPFEP